MRSQLSCARYVCPREHACTRANAQMHIDRTCLVIRMHRGDRDRLIGDATIVRAIKGRHRDGKRTRPNGFSKYEFGKFQVYQLVYRRNVVS